MIHRRSFIGSVGAFCAATGNLTHLLAQPLNRESRNERPFNWQCDVINTVSHGVQGRAPVVTGVSLQPFGNQLAVVGDDHFICIYDLIQQKFIKHIGEHKDWVRVAKYSGDGKVLATAGNDRHLSFWNTSDWGQAPKTIQNGKAIFDVAFSKDSKRLATVGFESSLRIYDVQTGTQIHHFSCDCSDNHAVAYSQDNTMIAAGGRSGVVHVWDTVTGLPVSEFKAHRRRIRSISFLADDRIVSCGDDQIVKITNPVDISQNQALPRHAAKLYDVAVLEDGTLASAGSDNKIHIWRMSDTQEVGTLNGHTGTISCLDVQQQKLVSGSYDTQVRVWHSNQNVSIDSRQTNRNNGWNKKFK